MTKMATATALKVTFTSLLKNRSTSILESKCRVPANTKIAVQRKFFTRKKRNIGSNIRLVMPIMEEKEELLKEIYSGQKDHERNVDDLEERRHKTVLVMSILGRVWPIACVFCTSRAILKIADRTW